MSTTCAAALAAWSAVIAGGRWFATPVLRQRRETPLPCRPLVVAAAALAAGCWLGRVVEPPATASFAAAWWAISVVAVVGWWITRRAGRPWVPAAWLIGAFVALGASWSAARFDLFPRDDLAWHLGESPRPVSVTATVLESFRRVPTGDDPRRAAAIGPSSECVVAIHNRRSGSRWRAASGRATVVVDGAAPDVGVGDRVRILGRGLRPAPAGNPGEFDFRVRARASRCLSVIRVGSARGIRRVEAAASLWPAAWLDGLRGRGLEVLEAHVSPARLPLASALLLGSREALPRAAADDFLATGTVHILSISGLHVGLLAIALFAAVRALALPRGLALVLVAAVTGGYMLLVRAETPVLRATMLVWLSCLAAAVGRRSPALNGLAVAAIIVLVLRPADVLSAGTQLSFLSTAVLVGVASVAVSSRWSADPIERLIDRSRSPVGRLARRLGGECRVAFLTGAAVWAATAPLVASRFHVVSPVGLVVNVLVAPLVALAMGWGFLCLAASCVSSTLAGWCGAACDSMLACIAIAVHWSARVPGGHWWVAGPPDWWVVGWYVALVATLAWCRPEALRRPRTWAAVAAVWCGVGLVAETATAAARSPAGLRGVVAAVGHGCGVVFTSPSGRTLVVDAGRLGAPGAARRSLSAVLWSERTRKIDHLVITHADVDHFNAVPELIERFAVGEVVVTEAFLASDAAAARALVDAIRRRGIPLRRVRSGDSFAVDALCRVRVLHPPPGPASGTDNEASMVLAVEAAGRRWLLTGDLEGAAVQRFVADDPDSCDVLLAPHHGSATSLPPDVAAATRPRVVVVSGAENRSWPVVRSAYAAASGGAAVITTARGGAIAIEADAARLAVRQFSGGRWRPAP
jgi:competence protein ComEC